MAPKAVGDHGRAKWLGWGGFRSRLILPGLRCAFFKSGHLIADPGHGGARGRDTVCAIEGAPAENRAELGHVQAKQ